MGGKHKVTRGKKKKGKVVNAEQLEQAMQNKFKGLLNLNGAELSKKGQQNLQLPENDGTDLSTSVWTYYDETVSNMDNSVVSSERTKQTNENQKINNDGNIFTEEEAKSLQGVSNSEEQQKTARTASFVQKSPRQIEINDAEIEQLDKDMHKPLEVQPVVVKEVDSPKKKMQSARVISNTEVPTIKEQESEQHISQNQQHFQETTNGKLSESQTYSQVETIEKSSQQENKIQVHQDNHQDNNNDKKLQISAQIIDSNEGLDNQETNNDSTAQEQSPVIDQTSTNEQTQATHETKQEEDNQDEQNHQNLTQQQETSQVEAGKIEVIEQNKEDLKSQTFVQEQQKEVVEDPERCPLNQQKTAEPEPIVQAQIVEQKEEPIQEPEQVQISQDKPAVQEQVTAQPINTSQTTDNNLVQVQEETKHVIAEETNENDEAKTEQPAQQKEAPAADDAPESSSSGFYLKSIVGLGLLAGAAYVAMKMQEKKN